MRKKGDRQNRRKSTYNDLDAGAGETKKSPVEQKREREGEKGDGAGQ